MMGIFALFNSYTIVTVYFNSFILTCREIEKSPDLWCSKMICKGWLLCYFVGFWLFGVGWFKYSGSFYSTRI